MAHPQYSQQRHVLAVYRVAAPRPVVVAAGDLSNTAFVLSLPVDERRELQVL